MFALELIAAGRNTQIVAARGAVELQESRELERGIIAGSPRGGRARWSISRTSAMSDPAYSGSSCACAAT
jgi:hypothetical protein